MDNMNNQQSPQGQQPTQSQGQQSIQPQMQQQSTQPQMQPNNNQPPKKETNWGLIGLIVGGLMLLAIFIVGFIVVIFWSVWSFNKAGRLADDIVYDVTEDDYTYEITEDEYTYDFVDEYTDEGTEENIIESDVEYQRVGDALVGYIDVPADYIPFMEAGGGSNGYMMQYSDLTGRYVMTLNAYDDISAEDAVSNLYNHLLYADNGIDKDSITGAQVTINGYDAYQLYGYYPTEDKYLVIWVFETPEENDYTHYLALEFDEEHMDLFDVSETYSPVK